MTTEAVDFWRGRCRDCTHPEHEMTCHEMVPNGDPSNGPAYCPCAAQIENMEQEIIRLRRQLSTPWWERALAERSDAS